MSGEIDYPTEYDNSGRVANADELFEKFIENSGRYRENNSKHIQFDLPYGSKPRNRMDFFWPDVKAAQKHTCPIVMFIHGGYWQSMDRSSFSHLASGLNERGVMVVMPSYTLCPDISIAGIVDEVRQACIEVFRIHKRSITVVGHSAGGHLAACMLATDWENQGRELPHDLVISGMGISGVYDLLPICKTPLVNNQVGLDQSTAKASSPILWAPEIDHLFEAWVGEDESNEFHRQSREFANMWTLVGTPTQYVSVPSTNHFTVIDELQIANSPMVSRIIELIEQPKIESKIPEPDGGQVEKLFEEYKAAALDDPIPPAATSTPLPNSGPELDENELLDAFADELMELELPEEPSNSAQPGQKVTTGKE